MFRSLYTRGLLLFLAGTVIGYFWFIREYPMQPLYVDLYNGTASTLPEVVIQHGKVDLQERIQVLQLQPGEHRIIALNHTPGRGFNVSTTLANGRALSICAGKEELNLVRATISSEGILPLAVR